LKAKLNAEGKKLSDAENRIEDFAKTIENYQDGIDKRDEEIAELKEQIEEMGESVSDESLEGVIDVAFKRDSARLSTLGTDLFREHRNTAGKINKKNAVESIHRMSEGAIIYWNKNLKDDEKIEASTENIASVSDMIFDRITKDFGAE